MDSAQQFPKVNRLLFWTLCSVTKDVRFLAGGEDQQQEAFTASPLIIEQYCALTKPAEPKAD
jgi:hypothetical protein